MSTPQHPRPAPIPDAAPNPPGPPHRRRWIVIGTVAVLVALVGVAATLYATGVFGGSAKNEAKIEESTVSKGTSVTELTSPSAEDEPPKYRYRDKVCEQIDWKPLEKLTGLDADDIEPTYEPNPGNVLVKCSVDDADTHSSCTVEITIKDTVREAEDEYRSLAAGSDGSDAEGAWSKGVWSTESVTEDGSAAVNLLAHDSNVFLKFRAGADGDDDVDKLKEHVVDAAEDLLATITPEKR